MTETDRSHLFTKENAAEKGAIGGRKSSRAPRKKRTLEDVRAEGPKVLAELVKAGFGRGKWRELDESQRLSALKAALPYMIDRPKVVDNGKEEEEPQETTGFSVIAGANEADSA